MVSIVKLEVELAKELEEKFESTFDHVERVDVHDNH
jgi:hypothetical protein